MTRTRQGADALAGFSLGAVPRFQDAYPPHLNQGGTLFRATLAPGCGSPALQCSGERDCSATVIFGDSRHDVSAFFPAHMSAHFACRPAKFHLLLMFDPVAQLVEQRTFNP